MRYQLHSIPTYELTEPIVYREFPLYILENLANSDGILKKPTDTAISEWESWTDGLPYTVPLLPSLEETMTIPCPLCENQTPIPVLLVAAERKGFGQAEFSQECKDCKGTITHAKIGARRLAEDIASRASPGWHSSKNYLSCALIFPIV